ncbi:MAG: pitrilysin family protein [Armatimonadota bacterium]|nr:pitrilysin family protein [Armatimonadota bacterium]MDR7438703.1 pitrilysin family protein [Armatimonadota bacterium]MDR7563745.1 pitrilysin family protein [Armatimonadota bacterium]MDR7567323.1 pitrilysin family protein [Armatimonadota bacterium]MDR7602539.1 pitrilysin family protein [Armatimonadota bacterium]
MEIPVRPEVVLRQGLPNGSVVLALRDPSSPTVSLRILLPHAGSMADGTEPGSARFVAALLLRGTERHDAEALAEILDGMGASVQVSAGREATELTARALAEDAKRLVAVCAEVLRVPAFPTEEVERVRGEIITSLRVLAKDPRIVAQWTLSRLLYPAPHPFRLPAEGTEETISRLNREELVAFWRRRYGPRDAIFVLVGDLESSRAVDLVCESFGDWCAEVEPVVDPQDPAPPTGVMREVVIIEGKVQADIALGVPGVRRADPDYLPLRLANLILGEMGLMGRIGDVVREQKGLAYYALSQLTAGKWGGPWYAVAGVPPEKVWEAAEAMVEEFVRMREEGPSEQELLDAIQNRIGWLQVSLSGAPAKAQLLASTEFHGLGLDYWVRFADLVREVSREAIVEAFRRRFPGGYALAVAGPEGLSVGAGIG